MVVTTANKLVANPPECEIEELEDFVDGQFRLFKGFDVATFPPSDHHFLNPQKSFLFPITRIIGKSGADDVHVAARKVKIFKEWGLLKTSLPNSIFVRAYSARPDLMRAAVIGLPDHDENKNKNNPYGYGLFFFDIMLPAQYPAKPPLIHHRFSGVGLDTGRLVRGGGSGWGVSCLGDDDEDDHGEGDGSRWDPERSSVLHALGFIQRRVLRRGRRMKGERCNEVFMLSHRAMITTLRDPPGGFEDFVKGYFRKFSHQILTQLRAHLEDEGFRRSGGVGPEAMGRLTFDDLVKAFLKNGSYCHHLLLDNKKLGMHIR